MMIQENRVFSVESLFEMKKFISQNLWHCAVE